MNILPRFISLCLTLILLSPALAKDFEVKPTLIFGVVPQQASAKLAQSWSPMLALLSQNANIRVQFATAPDIPTFEARLAAGEYDIAYMNPYHYAVFSRADHYKALARERDKQLQGIIVVRKDAPYTEITQLDGKTLAFPAPAAFAASVLPRANLSRLGLSNEIRYIGSHDSVYLAVARGLADAGGGVQRTFANMTPKIREQLRVLWRTPGYTPHAIATHVRLDEALRQRLLAALVSLPGTQAGQAALDAIGFRPLVEASDSDWDDVRALRLGELSQPLKSTEGGAP